MPAQLDIPSSFPSLHVWGLARALFLANDALRVEVADAAALAAGGRIDHRVNESRLAGIHRLVHGAAQLVGSRHVDTNSAECFDDVVVARVFDEGGRRRVGTA